MDGRSRSGSSIVEHNCLSYCYDRSSSLLHFQDQGNVARFYIHAFIIRFLFLFLKVSRS